MQETDASLRITWGDGVESNYTAPDLRRVCPCAGCVNEWTGERTLKPETISNDVQFADVEIVGRYALNFKFSDGHETGIYTFNYLRELGE